MSGLRDNLSPRHHNTTVLYHITSLLCQKIPWSYKMMSGSKAPDFDACGLLRATHSHNPTQYSHIVGLSSHFYAHIGAGPKVFHPPMSKLMWA